MSEPSDRDKIALGTRAMVLEKGDEEATEGETDGRRPVPRVYEVSYSISVNPHVCRYIGRPVQDERSRARVAVCVT